VAYNWKNVAILGGGFVSGIIFSPVEKDLIYARTDVGGAYRWNQADKSWTAITDEFGRDANSGIESLAADPVDANRCTWPREPTPDRGRATATSCVQAIAATPGKRPTCPSRWAATRMADRTANGSPSIQSDQCSLLRVAQERAVEEHGLGRKLGQSWQLFGI